MVGAAAIVGACLWAAMLWFFVAPAAGERLRGRELHRSASAQRTASGSRKGSDIAEPGMASGIAGSVAAGTPRSPRDSSLRSAA
jgi:hypothetical protein